MNEVDWLAERFEEKRTHLQAVAFRMLGSLSEADDAVQETWLRLSRSDTSGVENLGGWLTTVVARVCLDMLRSRASRREEPLGGPLPEPAVSGEMSGDPEDEALLADSVGLALLVVLGTPAEVMGVAAVAGTFSGRALAVRPALLNSIPGAVWVQGGEPRMVFSFRIDDGKITGIDMTADPERIG